MKSSPYTVFVHCARITCFSGAAFMCLMLVMMGQPSGSHAAHTLAKTTTSREDDHHTMVIRMPRLVGLDSQLRPFEISAEIARQPTSLDHIVLSNIKASVALDDTTKAEVSADGATYNHSAQTAALLGDVALKDSRGYALNTREMIIDLNRRQASSMSKVHGSAPMGTIKADGMRIVNSGKHIIFEGNAMVDVPADAQ